MSETALRALRPHLRIFGVSCLKLLQNGGARVTLTEGNPIWMIRDRQMFCKKYASLTLALNSVSVTRGSSTAEPSMGPMTTLGESKHKDATRSTL